VSAGVAELVAMLFVGYFSFLIVAFTVVAMWLVGFVNTAKSEKHYHPRPPIVETVPAEEIAHLHLEVTKEASPAKDDVLPIKQHHKRRVFARQRNDYEGRGYGNAVGYAQEQNGPRRFFNW
jgi:hypothetical protein